MELTTKLIDLLSKYIDEFKNQKEEYHQKRTTQTLYEELIQKLSEGNNEENKLSISILLNTIYGDNIYVDEFYQLLLQKDNQVEVRQFIDKINQDYINLKKNNKELKIKNDRNFAMFSAAKRVRTCLKYQTPISSSKNDIFNIKRILSYYEISGVITNREELLLINEIELHNRKVETKRKSLSEEKDYAESLYNEIPNILTIGFQEHDIIEVSQERKKSLDRFAEEITNLINHINYDEITKLLENYKKYNLDPSEYNYIIVKVLDSYLEELITLYELLIDKDIYSHRSERIDVVKNYYQTLEKYLTIKQYYNKVNEYLSESDESIDEETITELHEEKRLIYSRSEINATKAKFIYDMSNIPYEYYNNIYDLIIRFKEGTLGSKKIKTIQVGSKSQGHVELKDDNVRIVLRRVYDNIYNVLGVLIKKANNDMGGYRIITNRSTPDVSTEEKLNRQLELSALTEKQLFNLVQEKARKNGRK